MPKVNSVWAIDIGQAALKALKLVPDDGSDALIAEAFDYIEYPKILSQPDADADELVREALATFVGRNDLKGSAVAISIPGQAGLVKFIKLPPVEKKRIPDIVKFEARQQIPFPLEEVIWDYQQIGGQGDEDEEFSMAEVGLFAMKRDQIQRAIAPLKVAGVEVDIVQMGPIALYNYLTFDRRLAEEKPAAAGNGAVVLVDIGADHSDLIITDGTRIWQRNVPIGGNHFTRALTKELKLTFAKAEHLKKNATKAPDPKSVFTAMRGVFSDFAGEVNRSIGFYGSINRGAKIEKIVGIGNGFKLPGLQKFLEQNLSQSVERVEVFERLAGEDVLKDPRFAENLPSFGVAYGLAAQALGRGPIRTSLLPGEITQARMIRRKKPWALAASVLLLIGFSMMFVGDWRVWAKVASKDFDSAVSTAQAASKTGKQHQSDYAAEKSKFEGKKGEGDKLVTPNTNRSLWPKMLARINAFLPQPIDEYKLDPADPKNAEAIVSLRLHVDEMHPVWREDVNTEWFATLEPFAKRLLHPADKADPSGAGWIVQIVGHHFNPYPDAPELALPAEKRTKFGPMPYLAQKVLPRLQNDANLRQFGFSHFTLAWMDINKKWTPDQTLATNGTATKAVPLLKRASAPAAAAGASANGMDMGMAMSMGSGMMSDSAGAGAGGDYEAMMRGSAGGMLGGGGASAKDETQITYRPRCDFMIQFLWKPIGVDNPEKAIKEVQDAVMKAAFEDRGVEFNPAIKYDFNEFFRQAMLRAGSLDATKMIMQEEAKAAEESADASAEAVAKAQAAVGADPDAAPAVAPDPNAGAAPAPAPTATPAPAPGPDAKAATPPQ